MASDEQLHDLRAAMDVCNQRLALVLRQRANLVRRIGACKRAHGLPIVDPEREQAMLAALLRDAGDGGYPPAALQAIFTAVIEASRQLNERRPASGS